MGSTELSHTWNIILSTLLGIVRMWVGINILAVFVPKDRFVWTEFCEIIKATRFDGRP